MRRLFWMGVGAAAGASGTVWVQRRVRGHLEDLGAEQVVAAAGRGARAVTRTVVAAVGEGRDGMAEREFELRHRLLGVDDGLDLRRASPAPARRREQRRRPPPQVPVHRAGR